MRKYIVWILAALLIAYLLAVPVISHSQTLGGRPQWTPQPQPQVYVPVRVIQLRFLDPADVALLFGGIVIQGGGTYGGGYGGNSGGYGGGYGNNSRGGGRSRGGSR